ncbi:MAG: hypothetical protein DRI57_07850 [Deltaproteobacteria bacterium]|nr:MAG: hypothetical protein DRI57_07850 [Deltaproteobacteria bacterium]
MSGEKDAIVNLRQSEYNRMMRSCNRLDNVESSVRSNMNRMAGNLRSELNNRMSAINTRHELAERAKEALLASQLRNNLGQMIEDALSEAGWEITDATYEGEDFRGAVHVKLQNLPGDEIVTIIAPEPGEGNTIQNKLNISFFDHSTNDETFRQERLRAITGIFQEQGLDCKPPVCKQGTENQPCMDNEKLDFEKVRQMSLAK